MAKVVERVGDSFADRIYVPAILAGLKITTRHFFRNLFGQKETVTIAYPEVKIPYSPRWRGQHRLLKRDDGEPRCVACFMCSTACPADCIHIVAGEHDDQGREKFPVRFEIDELRCIYCGMCEEACPCDAIRMDTGLHAAPVYNREAAWVRKDQLLARNGRDYAVRADAEGPPCAVSSK
ncbi:MAG: NADH-quinone oxidoreductase subunit I [Myxococcales bacterium]|nr:NADH-quinone oxidoreductase subunit I [Myxococcales bacterium]